MVKFFVAKFQAFHQIRHVPTLKKARRGFPVSEGKEQQEGYGDDGQTTTPLDGSVRISSRIKSGEKNHWISSRIKKVELEKNQGVLSRKLHLSRNFLGWPNLITQNFGGHVFDFAPEGEVTYSKNIQRQRSRKREEPGFPYIFVKRSMDFWTDEPEKSSVQWIWSGGCR